MRSGTPVLLRQIRVLNWHSIYDRTVDVPDTGILIFGTNGSGKTSLQDALQYALFPDLRTIRFNTAVADTTHDRSLLGYVLQKIEDDAHGRPVYAHEERTTYVAIAFEAGRQRTTFIVGVEGRRSDMSHERRMMSLQGTMDLRELPFLEENRMALSILGFEKWVRAHGGHVYDKVDSYIADVARVNGSPSKDWPQLLKSSIGFKEIKDATGFVRRFLSEQAIDHKTLLETFQSYEDLRAAAVKTEGWIQMLSEAVGSQLGEGGRRLPMEQMPALHRFRHYRDRAMMYRVGEAYLPVRIADLELADKRITFEEGTRQREDAEARRRTLDTELESTRLAHRALEEELRGRGVLAAIETLEDNIAKARTALADASAAGGRVAQYREAMAPLYHLLIGAEVQAAVKSGVLEGSLALLDKDGRHRLVDFAEGTGDVNLHTADRLQRLLDEAEPEFNRALLRLSDKDLKLRARQNELEEERRLLHQGRPIYRSPGIEAARALFRERLGWTDARPLAEMIDVADQDELWRNAVEAELGWARFYFVVPAELYRDAQVLYEQYRGKGYKGANGAANNLFDVSIIDIAKLREKKMNRADHGSLAEKVECDSDDAQDYINYELGRVTCVTDSRRLRDNQRAVTPDLVYYRGFRLSSHDPSRLEPFIGAAAIERRLARIADELRATLAELGEMQATAAALSHAYNILRTAVHQYNRFRDALQTYRDYENRKKQLTDLEASLALLRNSENRERLERRDHLLGEITRIEKLLVDARSEAEALKKQLQGLDNEMKRDSDRISQLDDLAFEKLRDFDVEVRERGLQAYNEELQRRITAAGGEFDDALKEFLRTCARQTQENDVSANRAREDFAGVAARYEQETGFLAKANVEHPEPLQSEMQRLVETALPEQKRRLEQKAREMREGVVQNVLHTLGARFSEVRRLLDEINRSTSAVETRLGHFKIVLKPKPEHMSVHSLVERALDVLNFEQIDPASDFYADIEAFMKRLVENPKDRDQLCDYRSYFDFEVHNRAIGGTEFTPFRGTRTGGSGGERQVPYYVMTFALMDYLYKRGVRAKEMMGRLLLMDEVFHNMSDDNVDDVMSLARSLGLQIVMVTPGKLRTLAPRFGKTVQVAKRVISPREPTRFTEYTIDNLPADLLDFAEYNEEQSVHAVA
jgi:uncharacterized protein YPO0396